MDVLGEGHDEQRTLVKEKTVLGVKAIRVEKEMLVHEGDVVEDGGGCASDNQGGLRKGGDVARWAEESTLGHKAGERVAWGVSDVLFKA